MAMPYETLSNTFRELRNIMREDKDREMDHQRQMRAMGLEQEKLKMNQQLQDQQYQMNELQLQKQMEAEQLKPVNLFQLGLQNNAYTRDKLFGNKDAVNAMKSIFGDPNQIKIDTVTGQVLLGDSETPLQVKGGDMGKATFGMLAVTNRFLDPRVAAEYQKNDLQGQVKAIDAEMAKLNKSDRADASQLEIRRILKEKKNGLEKSIKNVDEFVTDESLRDYYEGAYKRSAQMLAAAAQHEGVSPELLKLIQDTKDDSMAMWAKHKAAIDKKYELTAGGKGTDLYKGWKMHNNERMAKGLPPISIEKYKNDYWSPDQEKSQYNTLTDNLAMRFKNQLGMVDEVAAEAGNKYAARLLKGGGDPYQIQEAAVEYGWSVSKTARALRKIAKDAGGWMGTSEAEAGRQIFEALQPFTDKEDNLDPILEKQLTPKHKKLLKAYGTSKSKSPVAAKAAEKKAEKNVEVEAVSQIDNLF